MLHAVSKTLSCEERVDGWSFKIQHHKLLCNIYCINNVPFAKHARNNLLIQGEALEKVDNLGFFSDPILLE